MTRIDKERVARLRREYTREGLTEKDLADDPMDVFADWFQAAVDENLLDANAMTLATVNAASRPAARIVLIKGFDERGFIFYTNYESSKARDIAANPHVHLCFYWNDFERQVRIDGKAEKLPREESEEYFKTRPRESQIGAWASKQSAEVESRDILQETYQKFEEQFEGQEVPLPDNWGGYVVRPHAIEFWQGRPSRMHDRILYEHKSGNWVTKRLAP